MMEYWRRREDLDAEVQSIMGSSEFTVYDDEPHGCVHIFRGGAEFTSALYPFNDEIRQQLREQAYILHNGMDDDLRREVKDINEKREAYSENLHEEASADWRNESVWQYEHDFLGRTVTPMFIMPEVQQ